MENLTFQATVVRAASKVLSKSNGGSYVLHNALVKDGVLAGKTVTAQRTLTNKDGDEKSPVEVGQEVTLHLSIVNGKHFFEIATMNNTATDEELSTLLQGVHTEVLEGQNL